MKQHEHVAKNTSARLSKSNGAAKSWNHGGLDELPFSGKVTWHPNDWTKTAARNSSHPKKTIYWRKTLGQILTTLQEASSQPPTSLLHPAKMPLIFLWISAAVQKWQCSQPSPLRHPSPWKKLGLWTGQPCGFFFFAKKKTFTLPETNSSHLKIGHLKRKVVFQPSIFRGYVSFREGIFVDIRPQTETLWNPLQKNADVLSKMAPPYWLHKKKNR